jgi:hypothetical protein
MLGSPECFIFLLVARHAGLKTGGVLSGSETESAQEESSPGLGSVTFVILKYFLRIRIRGSLILNYGSGSWRPVSYESGSIIYDNYLDIFVAIENKMLSNMYPCNKSLKFLKYRTFLF